MLFQKSNNAVKEETKTQEVVKEQAADDAGWTAGE
jgi:hypothetical protein